MVSLLRVVDRSLTNIACAYLRLVNYKRSHRVGTLLSYGSLAERCYALSLNLAYRGVNRCRLSRSALTLKNYIAINAGVKRCSHTILELCYARIVGLNSVVTISILIVVKDRLDSKSVTISRYLYGELRVANKLAILVVNRSTHI